MQNTCLLLIDLQNEYFPGGKSELENPLEACLKARQLLDYFRQRQLPLVHIQHISTRPGAATFLAGTPGAEIHVNVQPVGSEIVIQKHYPNSFRETDLQNCLESLGVHKLVIAGMMTHMCVDATTRAAFDLGYACIVAGDACATKELIFEGSKVPAEYVQGAFLAALAAMYARVVRVAELVEQPELFKLPT